MMALQQVEEKEISGGTDSLLKLEDSNETKSNSISDENKAGVVDGTLVKSASNADRTGTESASSTDQDDESSDENRGRKRMKLSNDPLLTEKRYTFLKKHFDELRTHKRIPNFYKRHAEYNHMPIKPLKFEDILCTCHLEKGFSPQKTNDVKELLVGQEPNAAQSDASTKSQIDPLAGHNNTCNVFRINFYFGAMAKYFTEGNAHPDLFLVDPDPPVGYKQKAIREMRKITVLKLRHGLEDTLEDWEPGMTDKDEEKWKKRNKFREHLHFILNDMLKSLIGPDESPAESEDDIADEDADDCDLISSRRNAQVDPYKLQYQRLKRLHKEFEVKFKDYHERKKRLLQKAVLEGYYHDLQKQRKEKREEMNEIFGVSPDASTEESEKETEPEKNEIHEAEKNEPESKV